MTTIIVGTDLSENARKAADWACDLIRTTAPQASLIAVRVVTKNDFKMRRLVADHSERRERTQLGDEVDRWLDDVDTTDVDVDIEIRVGRKARSLAEIADDNDADWLVVGQSGKGRLKKMVLGSTAENLALRPPCPLAIVHPEGFNFDTPLELVSAVDLGASSVRSLGLGADLVRRHGGRLHIVHVISIPQGAIPSVEGLGGLPDGLEQHVDESKQWARDELDAMLASRSISVDDLSPDIEIRPGYPIHEILDIIDQTEANMLTLGTHGRSRVADFMLGGIGRSLLKRAPCTKIVTPPADRDEDAD